jgi:hypothetical protein
MSDASVFHVFAEEAMRDSFKAASKARGEL